MSSLSVLEAGQFVYFIYFLKLDSFYYMKYGKLYIRILLSCYQNLHSVGILW